MLLLPLSKFQILWLHIYTFSAYLYKYLYKHYSNFNNDDNFYTCSKLNEIQNVENIFYTPKFNWAQNIG